MATCSLSVSARDAERREGERGKQRKSFPRNYFLPCISMQGLGNGIWLDSDLFQPHSCRHSNRQLSPQLQRKLVSFRATRQKGCGLRLLDWRRPLLWSECTCCIPPPLDPNDVARLRDCSFIEEDLLAARISRFRKPTTISISSTCY